MFSVVAVIPRLLCGTVVEQCSGQKLRFPAFARKYCSIDLSFSFARGARH